MRLCGDHMLFRNTRRKIKKSFGRYLSLMTIILIGVAFYAGIKICTPNIKEVQNKYYVDTQLMDIKLQSTLAFTEEDVLALQKVKGVKEAVGTYSKSVMAGEDVLLVHALENINKVDLISGRLPSKIDECVADSTFYKVGDSIEIDTKDGLKTRHFTVTGVIRNPLYTGNDYGNTNIGNGKIKSYIFIPKENFTDSYYTEIYINIEKDTKDVPYSFSYQKKVKKVIEEIKEIKRDREEIRQKEVRASLGEAANVMSWVEAKWHISDRNDVVTSYQILESQYDEVEIIANVIPLFFILVVILMTSNTMARMIVEERGEMGTFSSLGISPIKITQNYMMYVLSSTILGTLLGYFIGTTFIPKLIYNCFPVSMPAMEYHFDLAFLLLILLITILVMSFVTLYACYKELKQKPANLLRPLSPKSGKKVFLEKITWIWKHLSFSWKVTIRNIARYKKRVFMTLVGTAGCTFLILIGFAIKDSMNGIGDKQYTELFKYDNMILLQNSVKQKEDLPKDVFKGKIEKTLLLYQSSYKVISNKDSLETYLIVPENIGSEFKKYFILQDEQSKKPLQIEEDGVIVSPKIAKRFKASVGDFITIEDTNMNSFKAKITGITENYVSNYIYMSPTFYEKLFKEKVTYNTIVSKNKIGKDLLAHDLLKSDIILQVNFREDLLEEANRAIGGLNNIVLLLVVISSLLCFTVLYNLTSINISERKREIATLKVLGFKEIEANHYIYRETIVTVIFGILIGLLITPFLHDYIIDLMESDNMIFTKNIYPLSYLGAALLTFLFALLMQLVTYLKLKKIDMIESLKSVE